MQNQDIIRPFERSLFVQFGSTGDLRGVSTLRLDQGVTFRREGKAIEARYHDRAGAAFLVEQFSSESLASTAFEHLQVTVKRYARYRRLASFVKALVKWGIAPLILAILALAINMAATRTAGSNAAAMLGGQGAEPMVPLPTNLGALQPPRAPAPHPVSANPTELAQAMADGVRSGKYTVQLSKGTKGPLYVFSDPSCPHCQNLETELDKLAKDYSIYLFPVTVIGGDLSSHRTAKLLCANAENRAALWKKIVGGEDPSGAECANGSAAVAANDQVFRTMSFVGTPTIINAAGEQPPDSIPNTADAINQWMTGSAAARQ